MLASPKELKCIEIASPIIKKSVLVKVRKLKDSIHPIMNFRKYCQLADLDEGLILDKTKILRSLVFLFLVFFLYPFVFLGNFIAMIFFNSEFVKSKKKEIQDLIEKTKISYDVSENKSFLQLWSDKGLRDYGLAHMDRGPFSYSEKFYCISEWVKILYDENFDLKQLEKEIKDNQVRLVREFYNTHSSGSHITPANPIDLIPFEIDKIFGNYKVDMVKQEISIN